VRLWLACGWRPQPTQLPAVMQTAAESLTVMTVLTDPGETAMPAAARVPQEALDREFDLVHRVRRLFS
jgi:hypothetical protein